MTDLVQIMADAWAAERARYSISNLSHDPSISALIRWDHGSEVVHRGTIAACQAHLDALCALAVLRALRERGLGIGETEADGTGEDWRVVGRDLVPAALTPSRAS